MSNDQPNAPAKTEQFVVRMAPGQRDLLRERARLNRRAMNSEILFLIEAGMRFLDRHEGAGHA